MRLFTGEPHRVVFWLAGSVALTNERGDERTVRHGFVGLDVRYAFYDEMFRDDLDLEFLVA